MPKILVIKNLDDGGEKRAVEGPWRVDDGASKIDCAPCDSAATCHHITAA